MIEKPIELWVRHPYFDFIEGSSFGRARTINRVIIDKNGRKCTIRRRLLTMHHISGGYVQIRTGKDGKKIYKNLHRFIAECFIPNQNNLPEINHRDNDPENNTPSNLEWCTHKYNMVYKEKYGISAKKASREQMKPIFAINVKTLEISLFPSRMEVERYLGINHSNIDRVIRGQYKQTGGYWFTKADDNAVDNVRSKFGDTVASKVEYLMNEKN